MVDRRRVPNFELIISSNSDPEGGSRIPKFFQTIVPKMTSLFSTKASRGVFVFLIVAVPFSVHAGLFSTVGGFLSGDTLTYEKPALNRGAGDIKLLSASTGPDLKANQGGGDIIVEEGALASSGPFDSENLGMDKSAGEISVHVVRPCTEDRCETLSHIAEMYGVSVNTILWANDIDNAKSVQPGDTLIILPITGVRHVVKEKETLASIAKKYGAETDEQSASMISDILAYNRLSSASEISVGDTVVVPGGVIHQAAPQKSTAKSSTPTRTTSSTAAGGGSFVHPVPGAVRTQGIHGYNAVDLAASIGTPIRAAADGEVIVSKSGGWNGGYGNYMVVRHAGGTQTLYAHTSSNAVAVGATVSAGETIGYVGNTGQSTGAHLHFEVRGTSNPF